MAHQLAHTQGPQSMSTTSFFALSAVCRATTAAPGTPPPPCPCPCRLGDPELLAKVMAVDPYFITQVRLVHLDDNVYKNFLA